MGDSDGPSDQNAQQASQVESETGLVRAKSPPIFSDTASLTGSTGVAFSTPTSRGCLNEGSKEFPPNTSLEQQLKTESVASAYSASNGHPGLLHTRSRNQSFGGQSNTTMLPTDRRRPSPKRSTYTGRPENLRAPPVSMFQRPKNSRDGYGPRPASSGSSQGGSYTDENSATSRSDSSRRRTGFPGPGKQPVPLNRIPVTSSPNPDARGGMTALLPRSFRPGAFRSNSFGTRSNKEARMKLTKQPETNSSRKSSSPGLAAASVPRQATTLSPGGSSSLRSFSLPREPQQRHPYPRLQHRRSRSSPRAEYAERTFVPYDSGHWTLPPPLPLQQSQSGYAGMGRSFSLGGDDKQRSGAGGAILRRHYHARGVVGRGSEGAYIPADTVGRDESLLGMAGQHDDITSTEAITRPMSRESGGSSGHLVADGGSVEFWGEEGAVRRARRGERGGGSEM